MPGSSLIGSRIRERRIMVGMRQTVLAANVGISGSYLNLIEHNRRRIGGKLLLNLAAVLQVEPTLLIEGAEAALVAALRDAADLGEDQAELDRVDEFAGRFPGWAQLLVGRQRRVEALEHVVETLTDRMAHDPHLAASLHEVLSAATAIRSTASILTDTKELEPEWRDRFLRNINEDSLRLAESSQSLVSYLDTAQDTETSLILPQDEFDRFLAENQYHFSGLEGGQNGSPHVIVADHPKLKSGAARAMAVRCLERYQHDAQRMPLVQVIDEVRNSGLDPARLAQKFGVDTAAAMRRLASLPPEADFGPIGLVVCDGSGTLTYRKPIDGFSLPRIGAACALWPLFQAISRPFSPISRALVQAGRGNERFISYSIAQPVGQVSFDSDPLYEAHMLVLPDSKAAATDAARIVGASCRICPKPDCSGRREQSIMLDGF